MSGTFSLGVALTANPVRLRRASHDLAEALSKALGMRVRPLFAPHYPALLEALHAGDAHAVWLPPLLACRALASEQIEPVALPVRAGAASYFGALFAASDSMLRKPEDLRGMRAAWVDRHSAAGYVVPRAHLRRLGIDPATAFAEERFVGTHDQVAQAVLSGSADVGATYVNEDDQGVVHAGWGRAPVTVLALAGPIPSDVFATRTGTDPLLVARLGELLTRDGDKAVREAACELFEADDFLAPSPEHFEAIGDLLGAIDDDEAIGLPPSLAKWK